MSTPDLFLSSADNLLPRYWRSVRSATEHFFDVSMDFDTPLFTCSFAFCVCGYYDPNATRLYTFPQLDDDQHLLEHWAERPLGRNTLKNIQRRNRDFFPCCLPLRH